MLACYSFDKLTVRSGLFHTKNFFVSPVSFTNGEQLLCDTGTGEEIDRWGPIWNKAGVKFRIVLAKNFVPFTVSPFRSARLISPLAREFESTTVSRTQAILLLHNRPAVELPGMNVLLNIDGVVVRTCPAGPCWLSHSRCRRAGARRTRRRRTR